MGCEALELNNLGSLPGARGKRKMPKRRLRNIHAGFGAFLPEKARGYCVVWFFSFFFLFCCAAV
jgi:hypothetical protein